MSKSKSNSFNSVIPERTHSCRPARKDKVKLFKEVIKLAKDPCLSYEQIANMLNKKGFKTVSGKKHDRISVNNTVTQIRIKEQDGTLTDYLKDEF